MSNVQQHLSKVGLQGVIAHEIFDLVNEEKIEWVPAVELTCKNIKRSNMKIVEKDSSCNEPKDVSTY